MILRGIIYLFKIIKSYEFVRENIAKFIEIRDGFKSDKNKIFLIDGAS